MFCNRFAVPVLGALLALLLPHQARAESTRAITLGQALSWIGAANPRLAVADRDIRIAGGRRIQSAAIPNPEIALTVENVAGTGPYRGTRSAETTLQLGQLIEFPGKRDARITAASAETDADAANHEQRTIATLAGGGAGMSLSCTSKSV